MTKTTTTKTTRSSKSGADPQVCDPAEDSPKGEDSPKPKAKKKSKVDSTIDTGVTCLGNTWFAYMRAPAALRYNERVQHAVTVQLAANNMPDALAEAPQHFLHIAERYRKALENGCEVPEAEDDIVGPDDLGWTRQNADLIWSTLTTMDRGIRRLEVHVLPAKLAKDFEASAPIARRLLNAIEVIERAAAEHPELPHDFDNRIWDETLTWAEDVAAPYMQSVADAKERHGEREAAKEAKRLKDREAWAKEMKAIHEASEKRIAERVNGGRMKITSTKKVKADADGDDPLRGIHEGEYGR